MGDVVSPEKRSQMMAGIRSKNTRPEIVVRKWLYANGYRFRLHRNDLPGTPDIVFPSRKLAIFVHGCFWHQHENCSLVKIPSTRPDWWREKLARNVVRDSKAVSQLNELGWRVLVIWECETRASTFADKLRSALDSK